MMRKLKTTEMYIITINSRDWCSHSWWSHIWVNVSTNLLAVSLLSVTIEEWQCNNLCQQWEGTEPSLHPSLDLTYLYRPCSDPAIQSSFPAPSRSTPDWYLTARWWGRGGGWACLSLPFFSSTVNMWPCATHLGLEGTFLLWLDAHSRVNSTEAAHDCNLCYKWRNEQRKGAVSQPLVPFPALHLF